MSMDACKHSDAPHTVWWWEQPPAHASMSAFVPCGRRYDNRADAVAFATRLRDDVEAGRISPLVVKWIRVFRSDNEVYTCWRWPEFVTIP